MPRRIESDQSDSFERDPHDRNMGELRMTKREMDQFFPRVGKNPDKEAHESVSESTEVLIRGLEKFDPFRQIFRRMRKAKETQRKLTQEILGHMQRRRSAAKQASEPAQKLVQSDSEMEFCDVIFKKINQIYKKQERVLLYKGHGDLHSEDARHRQQSYSDLMSKDVDRGSFAFQRLFYQQWAVTTKDKRTRNSGCPDCCCAGNHILRNVLHDFPFLGVYDVMDLISLLGLKDHSSSDQIEASYPSDPKANPGPFAADDPESRNSDSDSDSVKSGEGYAALLDKPQKKSSKGQKIRIDLLVERILVRRFQSHMFHAEKNRVPVSGAFDSASLLTELRKYLQIWQPVYVDPPGPLFQTQHTPPNLSVPRITLRMRESCQQKRPCFVLAKHLRKKNWRVLGSEDPGVFANDWTPSNASLHDDRELTIESKRGPVRTSKRFLERVLVHFQESFKSFLRLRYYLSRPLVRFVERHFDFENFLLLERNVLKELLVAETQSGFALFWREFSSFCCYRESCVQCLDSVRSGAERVRVEPLPAELVKLASSEFDPDFLGLAHQLKMEPDKFVCHTFQEHRRFFQFICKMAELLSQNNITEYLF